MIRKRRLGAACRGGNGTGGVWALAYTGLYIDWKIGNVK